MRYKLKLIYAAEATGEPTAEMKWKNYWRDIVRKHQVVVTGWPEEIPFANLSDFSNSLTTLESLLRKWECGTIHWKSISNDEFTRLDKERDRQIEAGEIEEPTRRQRSDKGSKKRTRGDAGAPNAAPKRVRQDATQRDDNAEVVADNVASLNPIIPLASGNPFNSTTSACPRNSDSTPAENLVLLPPATISAPQFNGSTPLAEDSLIPSLAFNNSLNPLYAADNNFLPGGFMDLLFCDMNTVGAVNWVEGSGMESGIAGAT
jgi:hypothetical protein